MFFCFVWEEEETEKCVFWLGGRDLFPHGETTKWVQGQLLEKVAIFFTSSKIAIFSTLSHFSISYTQKKWLIDMSIESCTYGGAI